MTKKKIYIAGPMTRREKFNFPAFDKMRDRLVKEGFEVFSPADHDRFLLGKTADWQPEEKDSEGPWIKWAIKDAPSLRTMLGADLQWIAAHADAMVMLPGWEDSKGANAEWALAKALGLDIRYA
jgi:hypothetical protein